MFEAESTMPRASPVVHSMLQYTRSLKLRLNTRLCSEPMRRTRWLQIKDGLCDVQMHLHCMLSLITLWQLS